MVSSTSPGLGQPHARECPKRGLSSHLSVPRSGYGSRLSVNPTLSRWNAIRALQASASAMQEQGSALQVGREREPLHSKQEEMKSSPSEILVVEDDVLLRMALAAELRAAGFNVLEARDGAEAVKILESRTSVGLVIADADLPGAIDGVALDHWLRRVIPDAKVILVSRYETTRRGNAGFAKPFNVRALVRSAIELLADPKG